jgi:hypothetical protein
MPSRKAWGKLKRLRRTIRNPKKFEVDVKAVGKQGGSTKLVLVGKCQRKAKGTSKAKGRGRGRKGAKATSLNDIVS